MPPVKNLIPNNYQRIGILVLHKFAGMPGKLVHLPSHELKENTNVELFSCYSVVE